MAGVAHSTCKERNSMGLAREFSGERRIALYGALALALGMAEAAPRKPALQPAAMPLSGATASPSATPSKILLDTAQVRRLYLDGDFDEAIDKVETSLRYGTGHTHVDSVFAFKHLGVMYAAKYETREKGK